MMQTRTTFITFLFMPFLFSACKPEPFDMIERDQGEADFSRYVAVGNSLSQGYQDQGLYEIGQRNSFPALLARQIEKVHPGMEPFDQPMVEGNGSGYSHLEYIDGELAVIGPNDEDHGSSHKASNSWSSWGSQEQAYDHNNLGISGLRVADIMADPGDPFAQLETQTIMQANPYARFLNWGDTSTFSFTFVYYADHVEDADPTFFTNWLGSNDVLLYAAAGAESMSQFGINFNSMTEPDEFEWKYDSLMTILTQNGAQGICATIPDITSIPMFTTIKANMFEEGIYIETNGGQDTIKANDDDHILLTAADSLEAGAQGMSYDDPLQSTYVLDRYETSDVRNRLDRLNNIIRNEAEERGIPVLAMDAFMKELTKGISIDGIDFSEKFIEGGAFSLDGIHPNTKGYAVIANKFIKKINAEYGASLRPVDVTQYKGIVFP